MYASTAALVALSGLVVGGAQDGKSPGWLSDYKEARKQVQSDRKPLAVIFGKGEQGYERLSRESTLGKEVEGLLAGSYVCLYIDTNTPAGQQLAKQFEIPPGAGIVISDVTGGLQAFRHEGDLSRADLVRYLQRYSDPNRVVVTTESNPSTRVSFYGQAQPASGAPAGYAAPPAGPSYPWPAYSGGSCSSCSGGGGGRRR